MKFDEGWRLWRLGVSPLGVPQLGSPLMNTGHGRGVYALPAVWDGNRVSARCLRGCEWPPGADCECGIRFYSHASGFVAVAERMRDRHTHELLRPRSGSRALPTVISYGRPIGPCYHDPEHGINGSWRNYWRAGQYDVLALLGFDEYPMDKLGARYGVPVFTFDNTHSPTETLQRIADSCPGQTV
ncbi:hypothetical protein [Mycobacteroides abscessus]|uniref:hypothetical protein n=1 Tax=Mycobacteroides abscessus TaxID=36809 RepID=UPI00210345C8|nr:hypothetical protein [Mycobacteroides abscessus]